MSDDARAYAMRLLAQRAYTTRDLRRKLVRKQFPLEEADAVIERLTAAGLLNDQSFALAFARGKLTGSGASPRRIRQTLSRKGIPTAQSDEAIGQIIRDEQIDLQASLERVARKKLISLAGLDAKVTRRRLYGFLARRGYDLEEIRRVTSKLLQ